MHDTIHILNLNVIVSQMDVITIIPSYNEEKTIKEVVTRVLNYSDVLVVDDGSTDYTSKLAAEAGAKIIKHDTNLGKGAAIKTGLKEALKNDSYKIMVLMDGDGQHNPKCIPIMVSDLGKNEIIIGSRFINGHPYGMNLIRRLSNKLTTNILNHITKYQISDSQCGFRSISSNIVHIFLDIEYDDYVYESEFIYRASKNGLMIKEKPIICFYRNEKSHITGINVLTYILFLFKLILREVNWRSIH